MLSAIYSVAFMTIVPFAFGLGIAAGINLGIAPKFMRATPPRDPFRFTRNKPEDWL